MKNTLVCIHGYNSSAAFVGGLVEGVQNFNLLSFSMPGAKDYKINRHIKLSELSDFVIKEIKKLKHTKIYFLAHSFGGAIINDVISKLSRKLKRKVAGIIYLAPFHPYMQDYAPMKALRLYMQPQNTPQKVIGGLLKVGSKVYQAATKKNIEGFADPQNDWIEALLQAGQPGDIQKLDNVYLQTKDQATYIVGNKDKTISTKLFTSYVKKHLDKQVYVVNSGHSPLKDAFGETFKIIKNTIPIKKRFWLWKKLYK